MKNSIGNLFRSGFLFIFLFCSCISLFALNGPSKEYYEITVYHFNSDSQQTVLNNYFEKALLPALHRMNIKSVGVFSALSNDTAVDKRIYTLVPLKSLDEVMGLSQKLDKDDVYQSEGAAYIKSVYTAAPFTRKEVILTEAFPLSPQLKLPALNAPKKERVYELRSYESATEKIFANKVHMFNEGDEIGLFSRLDFNATFYSSVVAGSKMPNLMYMTCFENMADRDKHWKTFGDDPYWKKLSSMPEYQNNVSHIDIIFLRPADYSDL